MKNTLFILLSILILNVGCKEKLTYQERLAKDIDIIKEHLAEKGITNVIETTSGLHYVMTKVGTGSNPTINSTVKAIYKGYFLDGEVFDESAAGATFPLSNVIEGWQEGIPLMKKGGKATFFIPSGLAYGPQGSGSIPANEVIAFDVELLSF